MLATEELSTTKWWDEYGRSLPYVYSSVPGFWVGKLSPQREFG